MTINGTITEASPPSDPSGQYQVRYQDITITDELGALWYGRIGSKQGYQVNTPIVVTVEEKQGTGGTYNYFRKFNPQHPAPQQPPQQPPQGTPRAPQSPNAPNRGNASPETMRIVRGNALNAVMSATEIPSDMIKNYLVAGVQWILTGTWEISLLDKPDKNPVESQQAGQDEDDIPF